MLEDFKMRDFIEAATCFLFALAMAFLVAMTIFVIGTALNGLNPLSACWEYLDTAPIYFIILYVGLGWIMWPTLQTDY